MIQHSVEENIGSKALLLEQCESIISHGIREFSKVERALDIIKKQGLYEPEYDSFEDYCITKWRVEKEFHTLCAFNKFIIK